MNPFRIYCESEKDKKMGKLVGVGPTMASHKLPAPLHADASSCRLDDFKQVNRTEFNTKQSKQRNIMERGMLVYST